MYTYIYIYVYLHTPSFMMYMSLAYLSPKIGFCPIPFLVRHCSHWTTKVSTLAHVKAGRSSVGIPSV